MMQPQEYFQKEHLRYKTLTILEDISHYNLIMHTALLAKSLKAGFRPDQQRAPAGQSNGGQWVSEGAGSESIVPQQPKLTPGTGIVPTQPKPSGGIIEEFPHQKPDGVIMNLVGDNNGQSTNYPDAPDRIEPVYPLETLLALSGVFSALRGLVGALAGLFGDTAIGSAADIGVGTAIEGEAAAGAEAETSWTLGSYKSPQRWANQMEERGWTPGSITDTIANGERYEAPNLINRGNTATRYEYNGNYVVRDNQTREIIQIGKPNFIRPEIPVSGKSFYKFPRHMERKMDENTVKIYINLLEEGTPTWRPTQAIPLSNGLYKILSTVDYNPEDEIWEFLPNSIVRCEPRKAEKVGMVLLAVEQVS